jgi:hypothetical protein
MFILGQAQVLGLSFLTHPHCLAMTLLALRSHLQVMLLQLLIETAPTFLFTLGQARVLGLNLAIHLHCLLEMAVALPFHLQVMLLQLLITPVHTFLSTLGQARVLVLSLLTHLHCLLDRARALPSWGDKMSTRHEILTQSIKARENDIMFHQINIDNYRAAIVDIEANHPDLADFADQLRSLLQSSLLEQKKEQVMLAAIKVNLEKTGA